MLAYVTCAFAFQPTPSSVAIGYGLRRPSVAGTRSILFAEGEGGPADLKADIERFRQASGSERRPSPEAEEAETFETVEFDRNDELKSDIDRFRKTQVVPEKTDGPMQGVITVLGSILSVNLVIIIGLFLWFLSGVFSLYVLDNDATIITVQNAFDPFILPLLSTHMGLTFLSYGLEKTFGEQDPDDDGGFRL